MIKVVVDSTADLPIDLREQYGIQVVPVLMMRGRETLRDEIDISRDEFYDWLATTDTLPSTAAPSVGMFAEQFRTLVTENGSKNVISISLAGKLSGTYNAARQAADMVEAELPGSRIICVDSHNIGMTLTFLAVAAAKAAQEGQSLATIVTMLEGMRQRLRLQVGLDTLRYLEMGGRISRLRALVGTALNVKPILEVRDGEVRPVEQVRTWKRVPGRLVELARARGAYAELSVQYTSSRSEAEQLADMCAEVGLMERERIRVVQIGAVLGTHVGPNALTITAMTQA
ncbi:MAG: DegV family protein [Roseiflexaceae bacterium]|nr:DegV family protein [Roseiflexaceae bacterium]